MNAVSIPVPTMNCWPIVESSKGEGEEARQNKCTTQAETYSHTRPPTHTHSMYRMYSYIRTHTCTRNRYRNRHRHCNRNRHRNHLFTQHEI